jgi:hypothetical protein
VVASWADKSCHRDCTQPVGRLLVAVDASQLGGGHVLAASADRQLTGQPGSPL